MTLNIKLTGQTVTLENLKPSHLVDLEKDFDPNLFEYYPKPYSTAKDFVDENLEMEKHGNYIPFAIILNATGEAIGCSEYSAIDKRNRKLEIGGSWLKSQFHGSAINSEAKLLLLCHAFEELNMIRVQFTANVLNIRSRAAIEKIGAQPEGTLRCAMILPDGALRDDAYYSIISKEWAQVKIDLKKRISKKLSCT
jgi:N-acetyltransferase